jgi:hypothetical protein
MSNSQWAIAAYQEAATVAAAAHTSAARSHPLRSPTPKLRRSTIPASVDSILCSRPRTDLSHGTPPPPLISSRTSSMLARLSLASTSSVANLSPTVGIGPRSYLTAANRCDTVTV